MSKGRRKKKGPPGPDTPEGRAHKAALREKAAKKVNNLFTATRDPAIEPNRGEELKPNEGEVIE